MIDGHPEQSDSCSEGLGYAQIENCRPRPGLTQPGVKGGQVIGRFAAGLSSWKYEDAAGLSCTGTDDHLAALAQVHEEAKQQVPTAGIVGYIAYEAGYSWLGLDSPEHAADDRFRYPLMQFLIFDRLHPITGMRSIPQVARARIYDHRSLLRMITDAAVVRHTPHDDYVGHVRHILEHIAAGDIYQANYTQGFDVATTLSPKEIYEVFRRRNPAPYTGLLRFAPVSLPTPDGVDEGFPELSIVATSPERFWRRAGSEVEARPIKGTCPRGAEMTADRRLRRGLLASTKDRAELLMITDLERNDLGQIAMIGTVRTEALVRARATSAVWHLESKVTAQVDDSTHWTDLMRALFPCGSITGAPKIRAVEILRELERIPRGVYCGAIGWVDALGNADFAVAIRTAVRIGSRVRICGGGGIVADSDPESEYYESLAKIAPLLEVLTDGENTADKNRQGVAAVCCTPAWP